MADPNTTLTGCSGSNYRFGTVPFTRSCCIPGLDKAVLQGSRSGAKIQADDGVAGEVADL